MTVREVKTKKEFIEIMPLLYELQVQHVNNMPAIFRDFGSYENLIDFVSSEDDSLEKIEKGIETVLTFEYSSDIIGVAYVEDKKRRKIFALQDKDYLFVHCFIISEKYRNKGYGRKCLDLLIEWAKEKSFSRLELQVDSENKKAVSLYEKSGFLKEMMYMGYDI